MYIIVNTCSGDQGYSTKFKIKQQHERISNITFSGIILLIIYYFSVNILYSTENKNNHEKLIFKYC